MGSPRRLLQLAPVAIALATVAFFAPALAPGASFLSYDTGYIHAPLKRFVAEELAQGRFPAWNPYSGLGAPLVSGAIDAVQHPFNLLWLAAPFPLAFDLWVILSYVLAATGGWAWARTLGRTGAAAAAAALGFGLSGFLVGQASNASYVTAFAALPWMLAAATRWAASGAPGDLGRVALASALCAAAGDPQGWGFCVLVLPPYVALVRGEVGAVALRRGAGGVLASLAGAAPFILPVVLWMPHTSRVGALQPYDFERFNLHPIRLVELLVPGLFASSEGSYLNEAFRLYAGNRWTAYPWVPSVYLGAAPMVLAVAGAVRSRIARAVLLAAVVFTWMAMGHHAGFAQLARHLPVLSGFRYWEKMAVWTTMLVVVAASLGIDAVRGDAALARRAGRTSAALSAALVVLAAALWAWPAAGVRAVELPGARATAEALVANLSHGLLHAGLALALLGGACWFAARRPGRWAGVALACVVIVDVTAASRSAWNVTRVDPWRDPPLARGLRAADALPGVVTPFEARSDRWKRLPPWDGYLLWVSATLDAPWNVPFRVRNVRQYVGMVPARVEEYQRAVGSAPGPATGIWGIAWIVAPDLPAAAGQAGLPPPYRAVATDDDLPAFAVAMPHRPRAYVAEGVVPATPASALRFVVDPRSVTSGLTLVESAIPAGWRPGGGEARIVRDEPSVVEIETTVEAPALLVLNDADAPGWTAAIDGAAAPIAAANWMARGVWVPTGAHRVRFEYRTPGLREGWAVFLLGAAALVGWSLARRRRRVGGTEDRAARA